MGFYCQTCGEYHDELPLDFGYQYPDYYFGVPEHERKQRTQVTSDTCIIDGEEFFVRGSLCIPIHNQDEQFVWGIWVSLSKKNFLRYQEIGDQNVFGIEPAYFGWFSNRLPIYPETLNLKTNVYLNKPGLRPLIQLEPTDHPLAIEQREGISLTRVQEIVEMVMH